MAQYKGHHGQPPFIYTTQHENQDPYALASMLVVLVLFIFSLMFLINYNSLRRWWVGQTLETPPAPQTFTIHRSSTVPPTGSYESRYGVNNP